jgi:hypothetical protein
LKVADDHVAKALGVVERQRARIASLRARGSSSRIIEIAETTLMSLEQTLKTLRDNRERIAAQVGAPDRGRNRESPEP